MPRDITLAIQELYLSGSVGLGKCSKSTVYRWCKVVNERLEYEKCNWRVKADYKNCCLDVVIISEGG